MFTIEQMSNTNTILTDFGYFSRCSQSCIFAAKSADNKTICIAAACIKGIFAGGTGVIKHSRIYLQSFEILEGKLFIIG